MYPGLWHCAFFGWVHGLWSLGGVNKRKQAKYIKFLAQGLDLCNLINGEGQRGLACCRPWGCKRVRHDWATKQQQMMTTNLKKRKGLSGEQSVVLEEASPTDLFNSTCGFADSASSEHK